MHKNYVLDTNILLHDPGALFAFEDNTVVIPIYVLEEIDGFKRELSELGRAARLVSRHLDALRQRGSLQTGVELPNGGRLVVALHGKELPDAVLDRQKADSRILAVAMAVKHASSDPTIFLTKDVNLRIRADALGVQTEDYEADKLAPEDVYGSTRELLVDTQQIDVLFRDGAWSPEGLDRPLGVNEYVLLRDAANPSHTALGRFRADKGAVVPLQRLPGGGVWGVRPRNMEQQFALDLLLDDSIQLATLIGRAGTGKTLLAIAAGLHKVMEEHAYARLLVSRPIFPLGRDIGFLPGSVEEKLNPWMQPIFDNVEFLMGLSQKDKRSGRGHQELIDMGVLSIEALTYIRGRSIPGQIMIVDEAQNLSPHEVKTILTRAGDGTKIILTGDPSQIDNPYVDATNNGLTHVTNKMRGERLFAHAALIKGERSPLAELAASVL